ncbi:MAG TPA: aminomethyl-transferring glycine dehydrogenase subunit GcvPB, partial [Candidatus Solibacter sp.]|nr:aminomethyl-transferring glycine dehydrogenase subunit GcvPB [Candidatus Solibacter sp.]
MPQPMSKATRHVNINERLLFEISAPGKRGMELPPLDVPAVDAQQAYGAEHARAGVEGFPEVSEIEVIRHFTRLSTWNYAIDLGMYPLGSCTMKYNPRVNEFVARLDGLATEHPLQPAELSQGCLRILRTLEQFLLEVTGMEAITLQPCAGAQGEYAGIAMVRAYLASKGNPRKRVLVPDSAHGTNPATAVTAGYEILHIRSDSNGRIDLSQLTENVNEDVAALMVTNPNTLGIFEQDIARAAEVLHARGALLYMDGANMNALAGVARPGDFGVDVMHMNLHKTFSTPHGGGGPGAGPVAVKKHLEPFLPTPVLVEKPDGTLAWDLNRPKSIGRLRAFYGNFGVLVRALAYALAYGPGMVEATRDAVLNANYIRKKLEDVYDLPYKQPCMHEVVFSD